MTARDDAVKAAARALCAPDHYRGQVCAVCIEKAEASVDAASPILLADHGARIAAAIRAEAAHLDALTITHQDRTAITVLQIKREGVETAARIAETAPEEGP